MQTRYLWQMTGKKNHFDLFHKVVLVFFLLPGTMIIKSTGPTGQEEKGMAVTVNIYYSGKNGNAKKFAEEMISSGVVRDIRAEVGNIRYEYFFPMEDEETVLLIDSWENQQSIDNHHASPMMAKIIKLREKYDLHMKVERYLSDEEGTPASDKTFIRE